MHKFRIVLDIDDVSANTNAYLLEKANAEFGTSFTKDEITDWELDKVFPGRNMCKFFDEEGFFLSLKPQEGAVEYTKKLIDDGFEIVIATASPVNGFKDKALWLRKYFPHIPERNLILVWKKDCIKGDIMLDDALHNIETSICTYPVVFAQPWNISAKDTYRRVSSWKEFYSLAHELRSLNSLEN